MTYLALLSRAGEPFNLEKDMLRRQAMEEARLDDPETGEIMESTLTIEQVREAAKLVYSEEYEKVPFL